MNSEMIEWMICSSPPPSPADGTKEGEQSSYSGVGVEGRAWQENSTKPRGEVEFECC